jgi:uracil-DNA glycosylase family 4
MDRLNFLASLNQEIVNCTRCPRLVEWRETVAAQKKRAYNQWEYWGKPVPGFGDINGRIMVIGLAPGAHGSNRTGRMFTGDASGDFLYPALHKAGFASQTNSISMDDGLALKELFITAACRCAPPQNRPTQLEIQNCREYLVRERELMGNLQGIVALGSIAFHEALSLLAASYGYELKPKPKFSHGGLYFADQTLTPWLLASYHPSRQNTRTGRLTESMFFEVWESALQLFK